MQRVATENSVVLHEGTARSSSEQDSPIVKVSDLMTETLISLSSDKTAMEAARVMTHRRVSSVLVSRRGETCGIITDHDIISRVVAKGLDPNEVSIAKVMSSPLITVSDEAGIDEAAKKMAAQKVRRLVVERNHQKIGIIGESDIIRIDPELHFLIRERSKLRAKLNPTENRETILAGYCEECGNYSARLKKADGQWLDEDCVALA
jgi:signal-transduction protein with cAMP-binding, CBS, and nucleotidyltransferase domain